jgi:hypothetical protein
MDTAEVVEKVLSHISEKPWSAYTKADYTIEQWHSACLIHLHSGPPTSKSECKLPVKTPGGALSRNGVHAAAAALAGARTPLQAPPEQKAKAARALRGYYSQLGEEPPPSLVKHSAFDVVEDILEHHGVKGMKWGVRRHLSARSAARKAGKTPGKAAAKEVRKSGGGRVEQRRAYRKAAAPVIKKTYTTQKSAGAPRRKSPSGPEAVTVRPSKFPGSKRLKTTGGRGYPATREAVSARRIGQVGKKSGVQALTDRELQEYARRIQLEQNVQRLQYTQLNPGQRFVRSLIGKGQKAALEPENYRKAARTKAGRKAVGHVMAKSGKAAAVAALV